MLLGSNVPNLMRPTIRRDVFFEHPRARSLSSVSSGYYTDVIFRRISWRPKTRVHWSGKKRRASLQRGCPWSSTKRSSAVPSQKIERLLKRSGSPCAITSQSASRPRCAAFCSASYRRRRDPRNSPLNAKRPAPNGLRTSVRAVYGELNEA